MKILTAEKARCISNDNKPKISDDDLAFIYEKIEKECKRGNSELTTFYLTGSKSLGVRAFDNYTEGQIINHLCKNGYKVTYVNEYIYLGFWVIRW